MPAFVSHFAVYGVLLNSLSHLSVSVGDGGRGSLLRAGIFRELVAFVSLGAQPGKVGGCYLDGWVLRLSLL